MNLHIERIERTAALITAGLLIAGCGGSGPGDPADDDNDSDPPVSATYAVSGTIAGLENPQVEISLQYYLPGNAGFRREDVIVTGDGPFAFTSVVPNDTTYEVIIWSAGQLDDPEQRCDTANHSGTIAGADVTNVTITCGLGYHVSGKVNGLLEVPKSVTNTLHLRNFVGSEDTIGNLETVADNGTFEFSTPLLEGESYNVAISREPRDPMQTCSVINGSGIMGTADVTNVEVSCGTHTIGGTVSGMDGTGLRLSLSAEIELGQGILVDVEMLDIAENGDFQFEQFVPDGGEYRVAVETQPADPDQECSVENGDGNAEEDVTNVEVRCPQPKRIWRYDDEMTLAEPDAIAGGEQEGGIVNDYYLFGTGPAVPLGTVSGLDTTELFKLYVDDTGSGGTVYSNLTGKTYWLAAESPTGVPHPEPDGRHSHYVTLDTWWRFRKVTQTTSFRLEVSQVNMLAYDDTHRSNASGRLVAGADLQVRAYRVYDDTVDEEPFYAVASDTALIGKRTADNDDNDYSTIWYLQSRMLATADAAIWTEDDFDFNPRAGVDQYEAHVATAMLLHTKQIEIDLTDVNVGGEILVLSSAIVEARNSYSPEGGAVTYLRDPVEFEPGDIPGGITLAETEGLVLVDVGDTPLQSLLPGAGAAAPACDASDAERSVLAFDAADYRIAEGPEALDSIKVTRSGSTIGLVTARVILTAGSATAGTDFEDRELIVRFGDASAEPRSIDVPVINDLMIEADETMTVTLEDTQGCAELGPVHTAGVVIVDDDTPLDSEIPHTLGGTVTGLAGSGLVLSNLSTDEFPITANGPFTFPDAVYDGYRYEVRVATQPENPVQFCTLANGSGLIDGADVTNIDVSCETLPPDSDGLDPGFGTGGKLSDTAIDEASDIALQVNGKIVAVGGATISRYTAEGEPDTSFGGSGSVTVNVFGSYDTLEAVAIQADGRIVVAGSSQDGANSPTQNDIIVARYDVNGVPDPTFGSAGVVVTDIEGRGDGAYDVLVQADGAIVIAGVASVVDSFGISNGDFVAVRYTANGTLDSTFGSGGIATANIAGRTDIAYAAALQIDGNVVITGRVANTGGDDPDIGMVRFDGNGVLDATFGTDGIVRVTTTAWDEAADIAVQPDGSIVVSGFTVSGSTALLTVARFDGAGEPDAGFGSGGFAIYPIMERGRSLALQADGSIVVAGQVAEDFAIVRLDAIGALDTTFGEAGLLQIDFYGGYDDARAVAIQPDGKIVAAGAIMNGTEYGLGMVRILP